MQGDRHALGFTLLELMVAVAIASVLAIVTLPTYRAYVEKTRVSEAIQDIRRMDLMIARYYSNLGAYPNALNQAVGDIPVDPWGNAYVYLRIDGGGLSGVTSSRKDHNLIPINSDYDLYARGRDGQSASQLNAVSSQDDVVRANNGSFVGKASDY